MIAWSFEMTRSESLSEMEAVGVWEEQKIVVKQIHKM